MAPKAGAVTDAAGNAAPPTERLAGSWVGSVKGQQSEGAEEVDTPAEEVIGEGPELIWLLLLLLPCVCCFCLLLLVVLRRKRRKRQSGAVKPVVANELLRMYLTQAINNEDLTKEVLKPRSAALTLLTKVIDQAIEQKQTLTQAAADALGEGRTLPQPLADTLADRFEAQFGHAPESEAELVSLLKTWIDDAARGGAGAVAVPPKLLAEAFDGWHRPRRRRGVWRPQQRRRASSEREALMAMKGRIEEYTSAVARRTRPGAPRAALVRSGDVGVE